MDLIGRICKTCTLEVSSIDMSVVSPTWIHWHVPSIHISKVTSATFFFVKEVQQFFILFVNDYYRRLFICYCFKLNCCLIQSFKFPSKFYLI